MGGNRGRASYLGHARGGVARCKTGPETVFETVPETGGVALAGGSRPDTNFNALSLRARFERMIRGLPPEERFDIDGQINR